MIYFIRAVGVDGPVKIGLTVEPVHRLRELQTGHAEELGLVRLIEGGRPQERWLHKHYAGSRVRGEWFRFHHSMLTIEPPALLAPEPPVLDERGEMKVSLRAALDRAFPQYRMPAKHVAKKAKTSEATIAAWRQNIPVAWVNLIMLAKSSPEFGQEIVRIIDPDMARELNDILTGMARGS